jgi:hypothetical protein
MKPRLYIETTIPSYLAARTSRNLRLSADQESTQTCWKVHRHKYGLFVSEAVLEEAAAGDADFAAKRLAMLDGLPRLRVTAEVDALVARFLDEQIIPPAVAADAVHLALAVAHRMDLLLTWNCKHLHNPHLERRIVAASRDLGYDCPVICTLAELLKSDEP